MPLKQRVPMGVAVIVVFVGVEAPRPAQATTIVLLRNEHQLIIAADSKRRYEQDRNTLREVTTCKISVVGDAVFAASGSTGFATASGATVFDVRALARQTLGGPGSLDERIDRFDRLLARQHAHLTGALEARHTEQLFLEVVIAGLSRGAPTFAIRRFEAITQAGRLTIGVVEDRSCDDCPNLIEVLGHDDAIVDYFERKATNGILRIEGTAETARDLVWLEIADQPDWVGPPIDVVRVDASGIHWDARKPQCPEHEP